MTTKGMKIGRPKSLPCPCCGTPVLTELALHVLVATYAANVRGIHVTTRDLQSATGHSLRRVGSVVRTEFPSLFWATSGKHGVEKTWALTGDGFDAVRRILEKTKR